MPYEYEVIYLTGPPASGKSTLSTELARSVAPMEVINYGEELTKIVGGRLGEPLEQSDLRRNSSALVTPEDVAELDAALIERVQSLRLRSNILIDSHAVTKEAYGFRVTPFSLQQFSNLRPTKIVVLYAPHAIVASRIQTDPNGRPVISEFEGNLHLSLQASVALCYGTQLGIPVYFLDSNKAVGELVDWFQHRIAAPRLQLGI